MFFLLNILLAVENAFPIEYLEYISTASISMIKRGIQPAIYKRDFVGVEHEDEFILSFNAYNSTITLHLKPSTLSRDIKFTNEGSDGSTEKIFRPKLFSGSVVSHHDGDTTFQDHTDKTMVSIMMFDDPFLSNNPNGEQFEMSQFEGKIVMNGETYNIHTIEGYNQLRKRTDAVVADPIGRLYHEKDAQIIIYKSSDMAKDKPDSWKCGTDHIEHAMPEYLQKELAVKLRKRAVPSGCPTSLKELDMGIVMDCTYISKWGSITNAQKQVLQTFAIVTQLYKNDFNVLLGIIEIVSMDTCGNQPFNVACSNSYTINNRLSDFSKWRGASKDASTGLWHVVSTCATSPVVGLAWMSAVCTTSSVTNTDSSGATQYYSGTSISTSGTTKNDWVVTAHEIGHNFGAKHDCTGTDTCTGSPSNSCCECSGGSGCDCGGTYIMNPSSSMVFTPSDFSPCTLRQVCGSMTTLASCLVEPGSKPLKNLQVCGNGIVEDGEQCDNGANPNTCCRNCTLVARAQCDDYSDSCCTNCTIASSTKVCRPVVGGCDVADTCDGVSKNCGKDKFEPDGLACSAGINKDTYCASGQCTNRDMQCVLHQVSGVSESIASWDPIIGSCSLFKGQCDLWCDSAKLPCRRLSGSFLPGTKCGSGSGYCTANDICTQPDTIGTAWEFIAQNQVYVIIAGVLVLALIIFSYDACKRRKRRKRIQRKREKREREKEQYQVEAPIKKARVPSADVDKEYYYDDDYQETDLFEERRASYQPQEDDIDLDDDRNSRPKSGGDRRTSHAPSSHHEERRSSKSGAGERKSSSGEERRSSHASERRASAKPSADKRSSAAYERRASKVNEEVLDTVGDELDDEEHEVEVDKRASEMRPRTATNASTKKGDRPKTMYV